MPAARPRADAGRMTPFEAGHRRGIDRLLAHCLGAQPGRQRPPARERLESRVGSDLAALLVGSLVPAAQPARRRDGRLISSLP